jgi:hypothetical protein
MRTLSAFMWCMFVVQVLLMGCSKSDAPTSDAESNSSSAGSETSALVGDDEKLDETDSEKARRERDAKLKVAPQLMDSQYKTIQEKRSANSEGVSLKDAVEGDPESAPKDE